MSRRTSHMMRRDGVYWLRVSNASSFGRRDWAKVNFHGNPRHVKRRIAIVAEAQILRGPGRTGKTGGNRNRQHGQSANLQGAFQPDPMVCKNTFQVCLRTR